MWDDGTNQKWLQQSHASLISGALNSWELGIAGPKSLIVSLESRNKKYSLMLSKPQAKCVFEGAKLRIEIRLAESSDKLLCLEAKTIVQQPGTAGFKLGVLSRNKSHTMAELLAETWRVMSWCGFIIIK
jgi:hypothetical protein